MAAVVRPRLEELPEELVSNIVIKLDSDSSFAFRLACRALEQKSLHEWATEYFAHKAIVPSSASLKVLTSIAESEKLRSYVHHIYIVPALFSNRAFTCCHGKSCKWKHTVRQEENMHHYVEDQKDLTKGSLLQKRLQYIFEQLPDLHGITFTDAFNNIPAEVGIHGHASYTRRTNNAMTTKPAYPEDLEFYKWKAYVWKALMRAIALSGIRSLQTLYSNLDNVKNPLTLNNLTFNSNTLDHLSNVLLSLQGLRLQMTSASTPTEFDDADFDEAKAKKTMRNVAELMPSVTNLDLTFIYNKPSAILCRTFLDSVDLFQLTRLRLAEVYLDSKFLGSTICALTNVDNLFLEYIKLTKGTWPTILKAILTLRSLKHLHLTSLAVLSGAACFLKPVESQNAQRSNDSSTWGGLFGAGAGAGAPSAPNLGGLDFLTDEDDDDDDDYDPEDDYDSEEEEGSEDDDSEDDDSDDSMPDLEPPSLPPNTSSTPQPPPPAPAATTSLPTQASSITPGAPQTLAQALYSLYSESEAETDENMPQLEPVAGGSSTHAALPTQHTTATTDANNEHPSQTPHGSTAPRPDPDGLEPRLGQGPDRGRIICLNTAKEIKEQLPRFIKEYHVVDEDDDDLFAGGMAIPLGAGTIPLGAGGGQGQGVATGGAGPAPPPALQNMLNNLLGGGGGNNGQAGFTVPGPYFGPAPPPAAATGTANAGANASAAPTNFHPSTVEEGWTDEE